MRINDFISGNSTCADRVVAVDTVKTQLKKDFYSQIYSLQSSAVSQSTSTLAVLTEEELSELEAAWIELVVWKKNQTH